MGVTRDEFFQNSCSVQAIFQRLQIVLSGSVRRLLSPSKICASKQVEHSGISPDLSPKIYI